jgi:crossover junction endodeoxyribonuclease RuvC
MQIETVRILGIDPGSRITGYGILELRGNQFVCLANGCIKSPQDQLASRLKNIHLGIHELIESYAPQELAIESVFVHRNVDSALKLGQARGTAITCAALQALSVSEYSPAEIKKAVVGRGNAAKAQVQHMVAAILGLNKALQADAADALAVAICHGHSRSSLTRHLPPRSSRRQRWKSL